MSVERSRDCALIRASESPPSRYAGGRARVTPHRVTTESIVPGPDEASNAVARDDVAHDGVVSFDDESLILVDALDQEIGYLSKADAHRGRGQLHRAFSLFVFDARGRLLMQRRATSKRLWPNYWSNTCCSHPRRGEDIDAAIHRRLDEELGLRCSLEFLFKFQYQAQFDAAGAENELCWVFDGRSNETPRPNGREIADIRYIEPAALDLEMSRYPQSFTPWFMQEWSRILRMRNLRA